MTETTDSPTKGRPRNPEPRFDVKKLQAIADAFTEYEASNLKLFKGIAPELHEVLKRLSRQNIRESQMQVILTRATELPVAAGCSVEELMDLLKKYQVAARTMRKSGKDEGKEAPANPEGDEPNGGGPQGGESPIIPEGGKSKSHQAQDDELEDDVKAAGLEAVESIFARTGTAGAGTDAGRPIDYPEKAEGREAG